MSDIPATLDEAEAAGWFWLSATCGRCGKMTDVPLRMLKRQRERRLTAIRDRLKCRTCGVPPKAFALKRYAKGPHPPDPSKMFECLPLGTAVRQDEG